MHRFTRHTSRCMTLRMCCLSTQTLRIIVRLIWVAMQQVPRACNNLYDVRGTQSTCDGVESASKKTMKAEDFSSS